MAFDPFTADTLTSFPQTRGSALCARFLFCTTLPGRRFYSPLVCSLLSACMVICIQIARCRPSMQVALSASLERERRGTF
jgi:hypothetical protein